MALTNYISDLLYRYECVIVPGFGAFLTHKHSATYNAEAQVFLPPRKEVSFNTQLTKNDGLLANHMVNTTACSYAEALDDIKAFSEQTKESLKKGDTVLLSKIGEVVLNSKGNIAFTPAQDINYLESSFGLSAVTTAAVLRETLVETPVINITPKTQEKRSYLKYAAIAVVSLGLFGVLGNTYVSQKNIEVALHNKTEQLKAERIAIQKASFFNVSPIQVPEVTVPVVLKPINTGKFHIVAGAFRFKDNASKKIAQLETKGFSARTIGQNKYGLHQVVYASFNTKLEALENLKSIKNNHNSQAWLLVKKLP